MLDIRPMTEAYLHIDCLHHGPVDPLSAPRQGDRYQNAADLPPHPWTDEIISDIAQHYQHISEGWSGDPGREFMREMIQRYGTCAMLAWQGKLVIGQLRFYPLEIAQLVYAADPINQSLMGEAGVMVFDAQPGDLWVQCVMTSKPYKDAAGALQEGARQGLGQALVYALIEWAKTHGWKRIVKQAHSDLDCMYGVFGGGGKGFWEKAGFSVISTHKHIPPTNMTWKKTVEHEAIAKGIPKQEAWTWYHMAYELDFTGT